MADAGSHHRRDRLDKFNYPEFFGAHAWSTFGRLRPVHVNGVIWGAFSTLFIGLAYYVTPRLAGVRVWNERWAHPLLWVWNLNLAAAFVALTRSSAPTGAGRPASCGCPTWSC
jgi:cbb3-type cytochrome oxidase subunit 1